MNARRLSSWFTSVTAMLSSDRFRVWFNVGVNVAVLLLLSVPLMAARGGGIDA